jgi:hypothetical protein
MGMEKGPHVDEQRGTGRSARAALAVVAVSIAALFAVPGALADDGCVPENGCVPGEVEPPLPPDQAGNPQPVTIDWVPIPDVPPSVGVDLGLALPPHRKACHAKKHKRDASAAKKSCRKKRSSQAALLGAPSALADDDCVPENGCVPPIVAPPLPPDQAGDPEVITIGATKIPDAPPYVTVPMPVYAAPKACKAKHRHNTPHAKKCKKKRK